MGFNLREEFGGRFFKTADLKPGEEKLLTITGFERVLVGDQQKIVMHVSESQQSLVVKNQHADLLKDEFGDDTDYAVGKQVVLYVNPNVRHLGERVGGLELRASKRPQPDEQQVVTTQPVPVAQDW